MFTVHYAGVNLTDLFKVESIQRSILPPREVNMLEVPGKHGAYFAGAKYGIRQIVLNITLKGENETNFMNKIKAIAFNLDSDAPSELLLSDEPNVKYYAMLADATEIDEVLSIGKGTLTFVLADPFAYSIEEKVLSPTDKYFTFNNEGTTSTYPKFNVHFENDASFVSFVSPNGVIMIGNPARKDQIIVPKKELVFNDDMYQTTGWSTYTSSTLDSETTTVGSIKVLGDGLSPSSLGTGDGWHGVAIRKDMSEQVKDFAVETRLSLKSSDEQIGGIGIYLFDVNGTRIGKLALFDGNDNIENNTPYIYAGSEAILSKRGLTVNSSGISQTTGEKEVYNTVQSTDLNNYNDFYGTMVISRVGTRWSAEIARMDEYGRKSNIIEDYFYDTEDSYPTEELAYIVVHFTTYGDSTPSEIMNVSDIEVYKHNEDTVHDIPAIFSKNDELEVNTEDSSVWLNGSPLMSHVDVGSTFFSVEAGVTEVKVNSDDAMASYTATFTERYL